jgi:hypothetical protein
MLLLKVRNVDDPVPPFLLIIYTLFSTAVKSSKVFTG